MLSKKECENALENLKIPTDDWESNELQLAENNEEPIEYQEQESIDIIEKLIKEHFDDNGNVRAIANIVIDEEKMKEMINDGINKILNTQPYKFEDFKIGLWVYDTQPEFEEFTFFKITKILSESSCEHFYHDKSKKVFFDNMECHAREFEEGRFFPITKALQYQ